MYYAVKYSMSKKNNMHRVSGKYADVVLIEVGIRYSKNVKDSSQRKMR